MTTLHLYNTLTRRKEAFEPHEPGNVRMYVCGPTVYDRPHIGNARSVVVYDVLFRLLNEIYGADHVTYARNITDVDDKINARAKELGITIQALTGEVTKQFHDDMNALNVLKPTHEPRATVHVPTMIAIIEQLLENKHAYVAQGHVLYDVTSFPKYGQLSGRKLDDLIAGARVEVESYKKHPGDFVLWKPADAGDDPSSVFPSPWGAGRPGWHIECSAMSSTYLGNTFDLHGGGADLMFPHHENEIAQSCGANDEAHFAKYWVHNGFLTVNGEKMSKSLGNFVTVRDLLDKGVRGEVVRLALLSARYSEPLDWTDKLLHDAKSTLDTFYRALTHKITVSTEEFDTLDDGENVRAFKDGVEILANDLNTPEYLGHLHSLARTINSTISTGNQAFAASLMDQLKQCGQLLGILFLPPEEWFKGASADTNIETLIVARIEAKKAKNWAEADRIRKLLTEQGILLEDRPDGTTDWRRA